MSKILVVEDDEMISQIIVDFLEDKNHEVIAVFDGEQALSTFNQQMFDLVLLDVMLPKKDGISVLKEIRKISETAVIMLTAVDDEYTQLTSFNQMIDDYVTKPFSPAILMKRVENVLRKTKTNTEESNQITFGNMMIDFEHCEIYVDNQLIYLTKKEYEILIYLVERAGKTVLREHLVANIWEYDGYEDNRILDNHMKNLRKKLPFLKIKTIKGLGYKIEDNK